MNFKLFSFCVFFIIYSNSLSHAQPIVYDDNVYLNKLIQLQTQFSNQLLNLKQNITALNNSINLYPNNTTKKIQLLREQIGKQRQWLYKIQSLLRPKFNIKISNCKNISEQKQTILLQNLQSLEKTIKVLKADITNCSNCGIQQLKFQNGKSENYVSKIKQTIISDSPIDKNSYIQNLHNQIDNNRTSFINNLQSPNWLFGNITKQQYQNNFVKKNNTKDCPYQTPFAITDSKCISCDQDTPIWNLGLKSCTKCPNNLEFDQNIKNCTIKRNAISYISNLKSINWIYGKYTANSYQNYLKSNPNFQVCSQDHPFSKNQKQCRSCGIDQIWDLSQNSCIKCPDKTIFNIKQRQCLPYKGLYTNLLSPNLISPNQSMSKYKQNLYNNNVYLNDSGIYECPPNTPYWNNISCIVCKSFEYFNLNTLKCENCPFGYNYSQYLHNCIQAIYSININAKNIKQTSKVTKKDIQNKIVQTQLKNLNKTIVICDQIAPFVTKASGNICFHCPFHTPIFNLQTQLCQKCPDGMSFNITEKVCGISHFFTNINANKIYLKNISKINYNKEIQKIRNLCTSQKNNTCIQCPTNLPYFNGTDCIQCQNNEIFDATDTKKCIKCPNNFIYYPVSYDCIPNKRNVAKPSLQRMIMNIGLF